MIGAGLNGSLTLGPLPALSQELVNAMDYKPDLAEAKDRSYDLFAAKKKLDEASDAYDDTRAGYAQDTYNVRSARHTYEAALYEYKMPVQTFEMNFRGTFDSVKDYQQVLNSAQTSLAYQESAYAHVFRGKDRKHPPKPLFGRKGLSEAAPESAAPQPEAVPAETT